MPTSEFEGWTSWGYGTSHYLAIEYAGGGRDQFKHFVRECHRRGIAVLLDVVYNHYTHDGERAQWAYDSTTPENNIYYWYEGRASDYPNANPPGHGGYIDNMSTGYAPRYWEEIVRKLFISSAAMLVSEFHLDGFRVDQTTSIHSYAVLHANGAAATTARIFGGKFLREWTRTLRLLRPNVFLIAEDHSGWAAVTQSGEQGGLGFDATWYADFYHHLIGDAQNDSSRARLLKFAGYGDNRELRMSWFAGALTESATAKVVYHESHDEAGNSYYMENGQEVSFGADPRGRGERRVAERCHHPALCRGPRPFRRRHDPAGAGHPDVLHGRGSRRVRAVPLRRFHQSPGKLPGPAAGRGRQSVPLLSGVDPAAARASRPAFAQHRRAPHPRRQPRSRLPALGGG